MSKTKGNVIDPFELVEEYGADAVRYYLIREIPSGRDGDFSREKFEALYNGDLANGLGNFIARSATLISREGKIENPRDLVEQEVADRIEQTQRAIAEKIQNFRLNEAVAVVWELIGFGDAFLNEHAPWQVDDENKRKTVLANVGYIAVRVGELITPFLPRAASEIIQQIALEQDALRARKGKMLFPRRD